MDIQSVQGALASATSTNQGGTSEAMDVEGDISSATNSGNDGTGNEDTARQKDEVSHSGRVEFNNLPTNTPPQDIEAWFASQYEAISQEFEKPIQLAACQDLNKSYFRHWADTFAKYMTSGDKDNQVPPIDLFASGDTSKYEKYTHAMSKYWEAIIHHAEMEKEGSLCTPRDPISNIIRLTMPAKLKALQHGLMAKIHGDKFLSFFPVPTKLLLYTLGEQLKSIQPAIREQLGWIKGPPCGMII
ncbi:hypothetical protein F5141DRAFT_1065388 [Pisolithus sp. B1]|nr:hypothetical protein F5141DRAFT_1065388 [Pisolithus sp. B1]